jgi:hypothetical protein
MQAEGWYRDPYGRHGDRWFSDGRPTSLVRDRGIESRDEPPAEEPPAEEPPLPLVAAAEIEVPDGRDLIRADPDERETEYDVEREQPLL